MTAPTSPTSGLNEGETLTVKGHGLSTAAAENVVTVGGQPCDVVSAAVDDTYSAPSCPVTSCTQELQTLITLQCRLPHLDTLAPHAIQLGTRTSAGAFNGYSPALSGATITVTPIVRSFAPSSGSVAGGTLIRFEGDGLSDRLGDLDVTIGGGRCSVTQSNVSSLSCVAPIAADLTSSTNAAVVVRVRGSTAACSVSPCSYTYSRARTPILTGATIVSSPPTSDWTIELAGTFEDDCSDCVVSIGGGTPCALTSTSSTSITCTSAPPLSGTQVITLVSYEWGSGLGDPALPTVEGVELSATSFAPSEVSLAGGTDLVIGGAGFSPTSSKVAVCGKACAVTSVSARTLTCTVPSLLLHASGTHGVNLTNVTTAELDLGYVAPPPPPPGTVDLWSGREGITMQQGKVVAFAFAGLNDTNLPRGRKLSSVTLTVAADRGASGALVVDVRASLECGAADAPPISSADLALSNLAAYDATNATVEWDVQNFVGLDTEESPDLSGLLVDALDARATLEGCSVVVLLAPREGPGWRTFHAPTARDVTKRPFLGFTYVPPTTSDQLAWTSDRSCAVSVSVPTPVPPGGTCTVYDSATQRSVYDSNSCPHVELAATAATTSDSCAMAVNGLDLFSSATGCALDKLVVGRDGVCAALIDPYAPRAACFDTKTQGEGAEQLASWIDALPQGASAMIVSCSRLSWAHNRNDLATALAKLGALNPPTRIDDAYALVGTRGASTPLAEARTACCENPDPVCATCDQTPAFAKADVACGVSAASSASALAAASYVGSWGSAGQLAAVSAVVSGSTAARVGSTASSVFDALAGMQASDVDVYDAECDTALTDGDGSVRFGARLATDGDQSSYWYSAGRPDAVLTLDLGSTQLVKTLKLEWEHPASSVLALYSSSSIGSDWEVGSSIHQASTPPTQLALDGAGDGVLVRRVRLYMADAANATWPVFALRELVAESCVLPEATVTVSSQLAYQRAKTPLVTLVAPRRGSTAGGTRLTISVSGLPASITPSAVTVAIAGTACVVTGVDVQGGRVSCTTGSYGRTSLANPGAGLVQLSVAGLGTAAATAAAHYEYIDLWSRRTTWGGEGYTIPGLETRGDSIWIQNGQRILLDCDISVYMLIVQGALEFDRKDIFMDASYIFVMGGSFTVGTEAEPFLQRAIITLHGSPAAKEIPVYGAKALACRFCTLDLHGKPVLDGRTHTQLAQTAPKGATEIHLMKPVDWDVGSQIVVTSTAANGTFEEFDTIGIVEVLDGGTRLRLNKELMYDHLGEIMRFDGGISAPFRASVALLSRNVVVQGDATSSINKHGAHIILHSRTHKSIVDRSKGESLVGRIENIEVRYAGQMGRLGRYAIHFHMIGAVKQSYVRYNSIHHTYQRAIAIHGVHYLRVLNNVAFETMGHTYFVEDGVETKNIIVGNFGGNTRELFVGLNSDATPATYWLVNGDNYVERNVAAGSTHYGFWFFPEPKIRGASEFDPGSENVCPQGITISHFSDNEAHNNHKYGLRIFTGVSPHTEEGRPGFYPKAVDSCADVSATNPFKAAQFKRMYSWRNGRNGITFGSVAALELIDPFVVDNNMRGIEGTGADAIDFSEENDGGASARASFSVAGFFQPGSIRKLRGPFGSNKER